MTRPEYTPLLDTLNLQDPRKLRFAWKNLSAWYHLLTSPNKSKKQCTHLLLLFPLVVGVLLENSGDETGNCLPIGIGANGWTVNFILNRNKVAKSEKDFFYLNKIFWSRKLLEMCSGAYTQARFVFHHELGEIKIDSKIYDRLFLP